VSEELNGFPYIGCQPFKHNKLVLSYMNIFWVCLLRVDEPCPGGQIILVHVSESLLNESDTQIYLAQELVHWGIEGIRVRYEELTIGEAQAIKTEWV
jgi:hypothetical protein